MSTHGFVPFPKFQYIIMIKPSNAIFSLVDLWINLIQFFNNLENNVIIRDGLLTLDFKNNKLIQVLVGKDRTDHNIDEKEFNDFCSKQLSATPGQL